MDRAGQVRRNMAGHAARRREPAKQEPHPGDILRDVVMHLGVAALKIGVGVARRSTMSGSGDADQIGVELRDQAVEVDIDEVESSRRAPMAEQPRLNLIRLHWLAQQWILL